MKMLHARLVIVLLFVALPYAARWARSWEWLLQYIDAGWSGNLFLQSFNAVPWIVLLLLSLLYRRPASLLAPVICGSVFIFAAHFHLDLSADAQSAIALVFIPLYALVPILIGFGVGMIMDRRLTSMSSP